MRPRGRPRKTRRVFSFETPGIVLPNTVVLDTSFVVEALVRGQPLHQAARTFLSDLAAAGTIVYYNQLLELELAEAAYKIALANSASRLPRTDGRARRGAKSLTKRTLDAWKEFLDSVSWGSVPVEDVAEFVPEIMHHYGLPSYDAVHAATWEILGTDALITKDAHFGALPERFGLIYVDGSRLRNVRQRRARAR